MSDARVKKAAFDLLQEITDKTTALSDIMEAEEFDALSIFEDIESLLSELEADMEMHFCEDDGDGE